jgi:hypothetical protein
LILLADHPRPDNVVINPAKVLARELMITLSNFGQGDHVRPPLAPAGAQGDHRGPS